MSHGAIPPSLMVLLSTMFWTLQDIAKQEEVWLSCTTTGVVPSPCFSNFLARTTFVLESLPEAKNPGQDAIFGDFVFTSSNS